MSNGASSSLKIQLESSTQRSKYGRQKGGLVWGGRRPFVGGGRGGYHDGQRSEAGLKKKGRQAGKISLTGTKGEGKQKKRTLGWAVWLGGTFFFS